MATRLGLVIRVFFGFYGFLLYEHMSQIRIRVIGYITGFCFSLMFGFSLFSLSKLIRSLRIVSLQYYLHLTLHRVRPPESWDLDRPLEYFHSP